MASKQLKQPNLSIKTIVVAGVAQTSWLGWCLAVVETIFGTARLYASAADAWEATKEAGKAKYGTPPKGVFVVVYWKWGDVGHVAIYKDGVVYSSPMTNKRALDKFTLSGLTKFLGAEYLGWSYWLAGTELARETFNPVKTVVNAVKPSYKVVTSVRGYINSADAKARRNAKTTVKVGTYYVYNRANGMVNVTRVPKVPGTWINGADNTTSIAKKPAPSKAQPVYYVVRRGDALSLIAQRYKTTVKQLMAWNRQIKNANDIAIGWKLRVK